MLSILSVMMSILLSTTLTQAFILHKSLPRTSTSAIHMTQEGNQPAYKQLLEKAKQARESKMEKIAAKKGGSQEKGNAVPIPGKGGFNARDANSFKNKVPFDEDIYKTLKFTIQTLSDRMKDKQPLSPENLAMLEDAVDAILKDAQLPPPPPPSSRSQ